MTSGKNQVLQRYISNKPNHVICIDVSYFTKKRCYFVGIDLATIVGHFFKETPVQVNDVIQCLDAILKACSFTNAVEIVHSDRESLFSNDKYHDFLKSRGVIPSRGSSKGYDNQVVERLHRTIKYNLKKAIKDNPSFELKTKYFTFNSVSSSLLKEELNNVIESYNNTPHKHNYDFSPNAMDEAFLAYASENKDIPLNIPLVKNDASLTSLKVVEIRKQVAIAYANNWEQFFFNWREDQAIKDERLFQENLMLFQRDW